MRYANKRKIIYFGVVAIALIIFLHPSMIALHSCEYIEKDSVLDYLHEETAENFTSSAVIDCDYRDVIYDDTTLSITLVDGDLFEGHRIREGGEYSPQDCKPKFSTAIIVPYRDRAEQLRGFLVYMHTFFRRQKIHYRIFVIEQVDSRPFNRAKLLNIGAVAAMKAGYPCLVLHDIHLLPLRPANLYSCTVQPRQMSSSINKFRCLQKYNHIHHIMPFIYSVVIMPSLTHHMIMQCNLHLTLLHEQYHRFLLPYLNLFGGAVAMLSKQYKVINGMSNEFYGWGGEDDDLYMRIEAYDMKLCRFEPETSIYHKFNQHTGVEGKRTKNLLADAKTRMVVDGLSSLKYTNVATVLHPLFTHIMVDL